MNNPTADTNSVVLLEVSEDTKHNFSPISYFDAAWDLSHLDSFAFRLDPGVGSKIDVVVIFSCHCFTHSIDKDVRPRNQIPQVEIYNCENEERVLDPQRYNLSRKFLRNLVTKMPERRIIIANDDRRNYMTWHVYNATGTKSIYGVFFDTEKDTKRRRRIILRVQSAYLLDNGLTRRQNEAKKVTWSVLLKATYEGRKIKP